METPIDLPDELIRLAEARASLRGISLHQFVADTLRARLAVDEKEGQASEPPWMQGFGRLADLSAETARIKALIEDEFEQIEPEHDS